MFSFPTNYTNLWLVKTGQHLTPFAEVSCALLVLYVWYLKSPSSDLALREQKKSEESEQTAQSEKRPNAITLSLV